MSKALRIVLSALVLATMLSPLGAGANHTCKQQILVYSHPTALQTNVLRCFADSTDDVPYDGRIIHPGSTGISISYRNGNALGEEIPFLTAYLDGVGFVRKPVKLTREATEIAGLVVYSYDSETIQLPQGRTTMGCLDIELPFPAELELETEYEQYYTLGSVCE